MTDQQHEIDWAALAKQTGTDPNHGGSSVARQALAAILGDNALRTAVDWYVKLRPAFEHARSVLSLLRPTAARDRCLEIYRSDPDPARRHAAVELFRVVAVANDLPMIEKFLADPDPAVQIWGIGVLDQLLVRQDIDDEAAEPYLRLAEHHPNPDVRAKHDFLRGRPDAETAG